MYIIPVYYRLYYCIIYQFCFYLGILYGFNSYMLYSILYRFNSIRKGTDFSVPLLLTVSQCFSNCIDINCGAFTNGHKLIIGSYNGNYAAEPFMVLDELGGFIVVNKKPLAIVFVVNKAVDNVKIILVHNVPP